MSIKCQVVINKISFLYAKLGKLWNKLLEQLISLIKYQVAAGEQLLMKFFKKKSYLVTSLFDKAFAFESKIDT